MPRALDGLQHGSQCGKRRPEIANVLANFRWFEPKDATLHLSPFTFVILQQGASHLAAVY